MIVSSFKAEVKAKSYYPGKESVNAGWKMFRYFDSNVSDDKIGLQPSTPYIDYSNRRPVDNYGL